MRIINCYAVILLIVVTWILLTIGGKWGDPTRLKWSNDVVSQPATQDPLGRQQIPLDVLTDAAGQHLVSCPEGTKAILNSPGNGKISSNYKIPLAIHQTCKSRCVTEDFYDLTLKWKSLGVPYYFHDDAAIDRLVLSGFEEFPNLPLLWKHCITKPVVKADFWRLLLLYEYGGIYADLDTKPMTFQPEINIHPDDEMYTVTDNIGLPSFHFLSSMRRHSLVFFTLYQAMLGLLTRPDLGNYNPAVITGPGALKTGMLYFLAESDRDGIEQIRGGGNYLFHGKGGHTLRREANIPTNSTRKDPIVVECAFRDKVERFNAFNVTHYSSTQDSSGISCFDAIMKHYQMLK